jgi:enamine deaminase RidA (YjgF/YER057c/UK114 family)
MVQVTCFLSSLDDVAAARAAVSRAFPGAAADFVENERLSTEKSAQCEGIARGNARGAAVVNTPKVVLSGAQMAFHEDASELRLAFERLEKSLGALGVSSKDVVEFRFYSLTRSVEGKANALRPFPQAVGSVLAVEGLPSVDASMAVEVVVAVK